MFYHVVSCHIVSCRVVLCRVLSFVSCQSFNGILGAINSSLSSIMRNTQRRSDNQECPLKQTLPSIAQLVDLRTLVLREACGLEDADLKPIGMLVFLRGSERERREAKWRRVGKGKGK